MLKIVTVIGARPQFIKAAAFSRVASGRIQEVLVHTGQHHDANMSEVFFQELKIPSPKYNLGIAGGTPAEMTGKMMMDIERVLEEEKPDAVLVYGDTNSTLAGALSYRSRGTLGNKKKSGRNQSNFNRSSFFFVIYCYGTGL